MGNFFFVLRTLRALFQNFGFWAYIKRGNIRMLRIFTKILIICISHDIYLFSFCFYIVIQKTKKKKKTFNTEKNIKKEVNQNHRMT